MKNILTYFLISQSVIIVSVFFEFNALNSTDNLFSAYIVHFISMIFFSFGYGFKILISKNRIDKNITDHIINNRYFIFSYIFGLFGILITIFQVSVSINPLQYLTNLFSGQYNINIREAYLLSSDQGGISGLIKVFQVMPLTIYLLNNSILSFTKIPLENIKKMKKLNTFILILLLVRVFFSLDRLTILGIVIVNIHLIAKNKRFFNIKNIFLLIIVLAIGDFISKVRLQGFGLFDFLMFYGKLGIINLQLMINSVENFTYGFSTFLLPFRTIASFFNINFFNFGSTFEWSWNPAQYMVSYAFNDFGYFLFLFFFAIGYLTRFIEYKAIFKHDLIYISIYFLTLYSIISFISVPVTRSIEFWLMIIFSLFMTRFITKRKKSSEDIHEIFINKYNSR